MLRKIKPGYTFVDSDGSLKSGGQMIALDDEIAQAHREKLEWPAPVDPAPEAAQQSE